MKRWVFRICLLLILGAIVNVAVAWGLCWRHDGGDWTFHSPYSNEVILAENRFGWPARSLTNDPEPRAFAPRRYSLRSAEPRLPVLPIWPGFAINTVFYALILWMLFAAPFALRRKMRIKRGLCPRCAYDLRGRPLHAEACAECGVRLP